MLGSPDLLRRLIAAKLEHVLDLRVGELGHGDRLDTVAKLAVDAATRGADKRVEVDANVLRHHFIAVKASLVGRVRALELTQFFDPTLVRALVVHGRAGHLDGGTNGC